MLGKLVVAAALASYAMADSLSFSMWSNNKCEGDAFLTVKMGLGNSGTCYADDDTSTKFFYNDADDEYTVYYWKDNSDCSGDADTTYSFSVQDEGVCKPDVLGITSSKYDITSSLSCFPSDSTVELSSGETVHVNDVQVSDVIASYDFAHSKPEQSEVYAFLDREYETTNYFIELNYGDRALRVSPRHLVYIVKDGERGFIEARDITLGDQLIVKTETGFETTPITEIRGRLLKGKFAPATMSGVLIVDGAVVSSYAMSRHEVAHLTLSPLRAAYKAMPEYVSQYQPVEGIHPFAEKLLDGFDFMLEDDSMFSRIATAHKQE